MNEKYSFDNSELENIWYFFFDMSEVAFSMPEFSLGKKGGYVLSCEAMMSAMNTIVSIDFCMRRGAYADAYTLVRKLRDDLMQYLFNLYAIENMKMNQSLDNAVSMESFISNIDKLLSDIDQEMQFMISGKGKSDAELAMESWMYNELDNNAEYKNKYYKTSKYKMYLISQNSEIKKIVDNYLDTIWRNTDRKLNNYVHGNGIKYITANYILPAEKDVLDAELLETVGNIMTFFFCLLALIDSRKMQSSDYFDVLDVGEQPEENSQYCVCPSIVDFMNQKIERKWLEYIQEHEKYGMKILSDFY